MAGTIGNAAASELAKRHLLLEPEQADYLGTLERVSSKQETVDFLRQGLAKRPLLMQWHRYYQGAMDRLGKFDEVEREYDQMLAREPQNKDLMYLAGRVTSDLEKNLSLNRKAAEGESPCPYSMYSLSSYHLGVGEFAQALDYVNRAVKLLPKADEVRAYQKYALLAAQKHDDYLNVASAEQTMPFPFSQVGFGDEMYLHAIRGQSAQAKDAITRMEKHLSAVMGPEYGKSQAARARTQLDYIAGNASAFAKALAASDNPSDKLAAHVTTGDLAAAEKELAQLREPDPDAHLLIYLAAMQAGKRDIADKYLKSAIDLLEKGDRDDRPYAAALRGKADRPIEQLLRLRGAPAEKSVRLTALGLADPAAREKCFALARKLNFDKRFPHLLVKAHLDAPANR
jgi:tetratricopeptide (TPR) repeat protein